MVGGFTGSRKHGWVVPQGTSRPGPVAGLRFECGLPQIPLSSVLIKQQSAVELGLCLEVSLAPASGSI